MFSTKWFILVLISWCFVPFNRKTPFTNAEAYFPLRLQFISFFINSDPDDRRNISDTLLESWLMLLKEYLILVFE